MINRDNSTLTYINYSKSMQSYTTYTNLIADFE